MTKRVLGSALAASALALLAGGAIWQVTFGTPPDEPLPLAQGLVSLASEEGQRLMAQSPARADFQSLTSTFETQRRRAFCGVAASVMVLNALRPGERTTQASFVADWPTELRVTFSGMTLQELGELLRRHGAAVQIVHARDTTLEGFRTLARENLGRAGDYVVVNYERGALGQREGGHISPLAAYNPASDRFLILDVAAYRYPPTWVTATSLWNAMNTVDSTSGRTRGFAVVQDGWAR